VQVNEPRLCILIQFRCLLAPCPAAPYISLIMCSHVVRLLGYQGYGYFCDCQESKLAHASNFPLNVTHKLIIFCCAYGHVRMWGRTNVITNR